MWPAATSITNRRSLKKDRCGLRGSVSHSAPPMEIKLTSLPVGDTYFSYAQKSFLKTY
jgi:hypothetical protein